MIDLSIIIPVYNVEKYIEKCIESCINQIDVDKHNYEIIIVNDGTKDSSMVKASKYLDSNNINVIDKVNGGLSSARNEGLKYANGSYIWFVDSDDYINFDSVATILSDIKRTPSDILFYDINCVREDNSREWVRRMYKSNVPVTMSGDKWLRYGGDMWPMAQMFVYSKDFLISNGLKFAEGILHEDIEFKFRSFLKTELVTYYPTYHYNYLLRNSGSISAAYSSKRKNDMYTILLSECELVEHEVIRERQRNISCALVRNYFNYVNFMSSNKIPYEKSGICELNMLMRKSLRNTFIISSNKMRYKIFLSLISGKILYGWFLIRSKISSSR